MALQRPSVRTAASSLSRFDQVERQLEWTLERLMVRHTVIRGQQHASSGSGQPRLRFVGLDGGAATT